MSESVGAPVVGVNYFDHQFLRQGDFQAASEHHISRARQHNALLHHFGVVTGLEVTVAAGTTEVLITLGSALDRAGREVVLAGPSDLEALARVSVQVGAGLEREVQQTDTSATDRVQLDDAGLRIVLAGLPADRRAFVTVRQEPRPIRPTVDLGFSLDEPQHTRTVERPVITVTLTEPALGDADLQLAALVIDADGAVTVDLEGRVNASAMLGVGTVTAAELADGAVTEPKLGDAAVSTRALAPGAVTEEKLADDAVSTRTLADGAVTNPALAADAVGPANLRPDAVSTSRLQNGAVSTAKIRDEAVTRAKLAPDALGLLPAAYCSFDGVANEMRAAAGIKATRTGVGEYQFDVEIDVPEISLVCPIFVFAYREAKVSLPAAPPFPAETVGDGAQLRVDTVMKVRSVILRVTTLVSGRPIDGRVNLMLMQPTR